MLLRSPRQPATDAKCQWWWWCAAPLQATNGVGLCRREFSGGSFEQWRTEAEAHTHQTRGTKVTEESALQASPVECAGGWSVLAWGINGVEYLCAWEGA